VVFVGFGRSGKIMLRQVLFFQLAGIVLVHGDDRLSRRFPGLHPAVIGLGFGQFRSNPGVGWILVGHGVAQWLAFFARNRIARVCNLLVHFLHQAIARLVLGQQFRALQFEREQSTLQSLQNAGVIR